MKGYKYIIFNLDGTLLDREEMKLIQLQRLIKDVENIDEWYIR